jgi:hypothetical protein
VFKRSTADNFSALREIFPGCRVVRWQPVQKALSGKVKEAVEFVINWFEKNPEGLLRFNVVQRAIGMNNPANFKNNVRRHPDFKEALANQDIAEAQVLGDNRRGFLTPPLCRGAVGGVTKRSGGLAGRRRSP